MEQGINTETIQELFDIRADETESGDYEVDDVEATRSLTFEERLAEVRRNLGSHGDGKTLEKKKPKPKPKEEEPKETEKGTDIMAKSTTEGVLKESVKKGRKADFDGSDDIFGEFDEDAFEKKEETAKTVGAEDEKADDDEVMSKNDAMDNAADANADKEEEIVNHVKLVAGEIEWLFDPPSEKFKYFYAEKKSLIPKITFDGQIPYAQWQKELRESSVDMAVLEIWDLRECHDKMKLVQKTRDRVQEIALRCNAQYFAWERTVELFRGMLARVEYDKPVVKQDGIVYEHMRDMELYFQRLKSIHRSADQVLKNLELAFEALSRQVTISMQNKEPERYSKTHSKTRKQEFEGYDKLETNASAQKEKKKTGVVDWS